MSRKIFVNLPVADLDKSTAFFNALGFSFNAQFCDETAACLVISDDIFAMLLTHEKFASFAPNPIADAKKGTEVLLALSCDSRDEVDELVRKAVDNGGRIYDSPRDYGFMYSHSFQDPDGHCWELLHMDANAV